MVWGGRDTAMRPIILHIIQFAWSHGEPLNGNKIVDSILRTIFLKGSGDDDDMRS